MVAGAQFVADPRPGRRRRLQAHRRGPRRPRAGGPCRSRPTSWSDAMKHEPGLANVSTQFRSSTPQLFLDIDRTKAEALGVSLDDVNQTLAMYLGSLYVNSFNEFGRHWQVTVQVEGDLPQSASRTSTCSRSATSGARWSRWARWSACARSAARSRVTRYNLYTAAPITGSLQPGSARATPSRPSTDVADETLPLSMKAEWTELMFLQIRAAEQHRDVRLRAGGRRRLPGPGGPVRELVAAAGGHPGGADVPALLAWPACCARAGTSTSSCRSAWWCWSGWRARTPS